MEIFSIILFCVALVICLITKTNVVFAIIFGYFVFFFYAVNKKYKVKKILKMSLDGYLTCKNVFITFSLIAMLTGLWRCSGTMPGVICFLLKIVPYKYFLAVTFLLCSILSITLGSLVATASTMGVICMTIARSLSLNETMIMGAILSGVIVGDRMSTVSTSCLLVADLTKTDMYENIKNMFFTSIIPFVITLVIYFVIGLNQTVESDVSVDVVNILSDNFNINILTFVPIFSIIICSVLKINIRINVLISIVLSIIVGVINEKVSFLTMVTSMIMGHRFENVDVARLLNGGGFISIINVLILVGVSASFSGIIKHTDLIKVFNKNVERVLKKTNLYITTVIFSAIYSIVGCNQSVPVILTCETVGENIKNKKLFALMVENSTIIIPMVIPWNLACNACVSPVNGNNMSVIFAFYIYVMIIYNLIIFRNVKDGEKYEMKGFRVKKIGIKNSKKPFC